MKTVILLLYIAFCTTAFLFSNSSFAQGELIRTIHFKPNSFLIEKRYEKTLKDIAGTLGTDSFAYLKVFGYSDRRGADSLNDILSQKRAEEVYKHLLTYARFDTTAVYVTWIGESGQDVAYDLHFPRAHIQQRCVDIWVMYRARAKN